MQQNASILDKCVHMCYHHYNQNSGRFHHTGKLSNALFPQPQVTVFPSWFLNCAEAPWDTTANSPWTLTISEGNTRLLLNTSGTPIMKLFAPNL